MHIAIATVGSRGDIQPFLALAVGLKRAGHQIKFITTQNFAPFIAQYDIPLHPMPADMQAMLEGETGRKLMESGKNPIKFLRAFRTTTQEMVTKAGYAFLDAFEDVDMIISANAMSMGLVTFAQKYHLPLIHVLLQPVLPTSEFPNPLLPELPFKSAAYNRLSTHGMLRVFWWFFASYLNDMRRDYLNMPKQSYREMSDFLNRSQILMAYSPQIVPQPADWGEKVHTTGYWFLEAAEAWQPPQSLMDFLNAGAPPVYIGFGSMNTKDPKATARIALEALERTGQRGILLTGWGGLSASDVPENVYMIDSVPHDWLFPRMAAVVHHGGAGTTAAALRAGVPSMTVPFMADQPFWARQAVKLGVSPGMLPMKEWNADTLAAMIQRMVSDTEMQRRAAEVGAQIRTEDGIARAIEVIERFNKVKTAEVANRVPAV